MTSLSAPETRDPPDPPRNLWRIVGPGIVAAGVGISSGEFILWPFIASQVGLVFLWAAVLGILTQLYLNMEIERYTLATGETALTGFNRSWKHWGLVFAVLVYVGNLWPGWALSSATLDVLKSTYFRESEVTESRIYFWPVWGLVAIGCGIIVIGLTQPMVLLVISACVGGTMMFLYSGLLIKLNRTFLPDAIKVRSFRLAVLVWSIVFFGVLAGLTVWQQAARFL